MSESALAATGTRGVAQLAPPAAKATARAARARGAAKWLAVIIGSAGAAVAAFWSYQQYAAPPTSGSLSLQTAPAGAQVSIDGKAAGVTPLTLSLPAGGYHVALQAPGGARREFQVTVTGGGSVVQHLEMGAAPVRAEAATGGLRVETEPARQEVFVDGVSRGISPVSVSSLAAGEHVVMVRGAGGTRTRSITVQEGATASLVISTADASALRAGWVRFVSPVELQLSRNGSIIGTTASDRVILPAGDHMVEISNDRLGFRTTQRINVVADRTTTVPIDVPNGRLSINALPWAEVWIRGERIGETPIANISRPIGSHEVVLRHPQFGERKATVTVTATDTARLGVDMRNP